MHFLEIIKGATLLKVLKSLFQEEVIHVFKQLLIVQTIVNFHPHPWPHFLDNFHNHWEL